MSALATEVTTELGAGDTCVQVSKEECQQKVLPVCASVRRSEQETKAARPCRVSQSQGGGCRATSFPCPVGSRGHRAKEARFWEQAAFAWSIQKQGPELPGPGTVMRASLYSECRLTRMWPTLQDPGTQQVLRDRHSSSTGSSSPGQGAQQTPIGANEGVDLGAEPRSPPPLQACLGWERRPEQSNMPDQETEMRWTTVFLKPKPWQTDCFPITGWGRPVIHKFVVIG